MKHRIRFALGLFALALFAAFGVNAVRCQDIPLPQPIVHPPHPSAKDFFDNLRILEIEVLAYEPVEQVLRWKFEEGELVEVGEFQLTKDTHVVGEIKKGKKRMVIFCSGAHGTGLNERRKYLLQIEE